MNPIPVKIQSAVEELDYDSDKNHAHFLQMDFDFKVDQESLSIEARSILKKYGAWMEALANGTIQPRTPGQFRFLDVVSGNIQPESVYEHAWFELVQKRADMVRHPPVRSMRPNVITQHGAAGVPASWRYETGYRPAAKRPGDTCGVQNRIDAGIGEGE